jgi:molecular chaperone DnaK
MLVAEAREAVENEAGVDKVRPLASELQQVFAGLAAHQAGAAAGGPAGTGSPDGSGPDGAAPNGAGGDDDVIDAEFDKG